MLFEVERDANLAVGLELWSEPQIPETMACRLAASSTESVGAV